LLIYSIENIDEYINKLKDKIKNITDEENIVVIGTKKLKEILNELITELTKYKLKDKYI